MSKKENNWEHKFDKLVAESGRMGSHNYTTSRIAESLNENELETIKGFFRTEIKNQKQQALQQAIKVVEEMKNKEDGVDLTDEGDQKKQTWFKNGIGASLKKLKQLKEEQ